MKCPECTKKEEPKTQYKKGRFLCIHCWHDIPDGWNLPSTRECKKCGKTKQIDYSRLLK